MAVNIKSLTFGMPTFTGSGSTATITAIPIIVETFENDLDNELVTKVFQSFNSGTGQFSDITGATLTVGADNKKTNATINFSTALSVDTTILVRLSETSITTPEDTNDTSFVMRNLYDLFAAGTSSDPTPIKLSDTAGDYKVTLSQIDETTANIDSNTISTAKPPTTATLAVITDYVSILPGSVVKVSITNAQDADSTNFAGSIRSTFKVVSV